MPKPYRRPADDVPYMRYLPCNYCLGFFKKDGLWQHMKVCPLKVNSSGGKQERVQAKCALLLPVGEGASQKLRENVLEKMQHDDVSIVVKNDPLILNYGSRLYDKVGHDKHTHNYVSQKMRELGRLLQKARHQSKSISNLNTMIDPGQFNTARSDDVINHRQIPPSVKTTERHLATNDDRNLSSLRLDDKCGMRNCTRRRLLSASASATECLRRERESNFFYFRRNQHFYC